LSIDRYANLAIANILKEGLTDIFPEPFEVGLLECMEFRKIIKAELCKAVAGGSLESLRMHPIEHVLLPKTTAFNFRRCALIHPIDTLKYLTLVLTVAEAIEKQRVPVSKQIVFSYRFAPSKGYLFNQRYTITSFRRNVQQKVRQQRVKIMVSCDISNFYDRLNLHRLESILHSIGIEKAKVSFINKLLLAWANLDSYGLPVGSNASRILAEAALIETDRYLMSIGAKFCRFVDDYRFFAPNSITAHFWLTQLIERLSMEGLTINMSKTKIEDVSNLRPKEDINKTTVTSESSVSSSEAHAEKPEQKPFRIVAGYGGTIPTRFRNVSDKEKERLMGTDSEGLIEKITKQPLASPEDVLLFIRSSVSCERWSHLKHLPKALECFPQCTPYAVDALIKHNMLIDETIRSQLKMYFSRKLDEETYMPEYVEIELIKLLGTEGYKDGDILFKRFRALRRNAGAYVGRVLLDSLENTIDRGKTLEVRRYFIRADAWEKRQIVRLVCRHLHDEEIRAWLKVVKIQESGDSFLMEIIEPSATKKRKRKASRKKSMPSPPKKSNSN
jgi:hypothetical protein